MKRIIKKSITLMLAIIMAMGIMTFENREISADGENEITSVTVNVPVPKVGEYPGMVTIADDQPYMCSRYQWVYSFDTGVVIPSDHVFSAEEIGKTVYVYIVLGPMGETTAFSDSLSASDVTIPGVKEIVDIDVSKYTLEIKASFEVSSDIISEITLNIDPPRVGDSTMSASVSIPEDVDYSLLPDPGGYEWYKADNPGSIFVPDYFGNDDVGSEVYVVLIFNASRGYLFSKSLSVNVEGTSRPTKIEFIDEDRQIICYVYFEVQEAFVEYPLWVGKDQVTSEYLKNDDEGWEYDPASNTLYLDNAKITDTNTYIVTRDCISYKGSPSDVLTISLSGNSTVGDENAQYAIETYASSLIITGNGSLTINAEYEVIDSGISLTIKDVSITANTGNIFSMRGMVINNSTVTVSNGTLWNSEKSIKITDSRVEVTDEPYGVGIGSDYSNISISGDSYVKADVTGSESKEEKFAMLFVDSLELKDGVEIVEPEEAEISNYKLPGTTSNTYSIFEKGSSTPAQKVIIAKTYTIKFFNDDGTELQSSKVITGEMPKYEGDTPTKPSDGKYEYTFKGWDKEIIEAKADATYMAVFESKEISSPEPAPTPVAPYQIPMTGIE